MKIHYLNGADIEGGAAKAATRLLHGVRTLGIDAQLHVQRKYGDDPLVVGPRSPLGKAFGFARPTIERFLFGMRPGRIDGPFCAAFLPDGLAGLASDMAPDIIHLHWVARMMRLETLARLNVPLVWTMHDSWAFTGGCYLPGACTRYRESCGKCPVLSSCRENDLSHWIWRRKLEAWQNLNLTVIAPSRWMADCARASSLFRDTRVEVIPNGIDINKFTPTDRRLARRKLSLPQDKRLILFGAKGMANDRNKGFHLLVEALQLLVSDHGYDKIELVIFGSTQSNQTTDYKIKTNYLGWQQEEASLATLYAAVDVFIFPSIQESLGYTAMEAMACGTPCVAFNQGGVPDLIDHKQNGYLARPYEPAELARGIAWVLEDDERRDELSTHARSKVVKNFALKKVAESHVSLYRELLNHA